MLASKEMVALLQKGDLKGALVSLDQMVLKVRTDYNKRFDSAAPAAGQKRPRACGYCKGTELPYHATKRTCPKRLREEAAAAAAGSE